MIGWRERSRRLCLVYVVSGVALGLIVGWGRLGADVGGVLTIGGGFTVATLLMLPKGITRRALLVAALVPFLAIAALILVDLGLSGGSHLSRNLTRSQGFTDLWELVSRRYQLAFGVLRQGRTVPTFVGAALGIVFALRNRATLYAPLRGRAWPAALRGRSGLWGDGCPHQRLRTGAADQRGHRVGCDHRVRAGLSRPRSARRCSGGPARITCAA